MIEALKQIAPKHALNFCAIVFVAQAFSGELSAQDFPKLPEPQGVWMEHCQDDKSISAESIIASCSTFISQRTIENWKLEYISHAIYYRALAEDRLGQETAALTDLERDMKRYPSFTAAWTAFGIIAERLKGPGEMSRVMGAMVKLNPHNAQVLNNACWQRAIRGEDLSAALSNCDEAVNLDPTEAHYDSRCLVHSGWATMQTLSRIALPCSKRVRR